MKILIYMPSHWADEWTGVAATFPDHQFAFASDVRSAVAEIRDAEVLIVLGAAIEPEVLDAGAVLRWVQVASAGIDSLAALGADRYGHLLITNARALLASHVAETAVALLTALTRGMHHAALRQTEHRWVTDYNYDEVAGKRALIVGVGGIGRAVARRYHALEMEVRGADMFAGEPDDHLRSVDDVSALPNLLPQTDVLTLCCPYTPQTHHIIDQAAFDALPEDAYLINVARGPCVDTSALTRTVRAGRLRGVGLDVVEEEPLPPESEVWDLPNVLISPHMAGASPRRAERVIPFVTENLRRYFAGEPLNNVVDLALGF